MYDESKCLTATCTWQWVHFNWTYFHPVITAWLEYVVNGLHNIGLDRMFFSRQFASACMRPYTGHCNSTTIEAEPHVSLFCISHSRLEVSRFFTWQYIRPRVDLHLPLRKNQVVMDWKWLHVSPLWVESLFAGSLNFAVKLTETYTKDSWILRTRNVDNYVCKNVTETD